MAEKAHSSRTGFGLALFLSLLIFAVLLNGCVTKSQAREQARVAYLAGQRAAYMQQQQERARGPSVTMIGPVTNHFVKWVPGLTLGRAIVKSDYLAAKDPSNIIIRRNGQEMDYDPKRLLQGEDFPLQAGDVVELQQ